MKIGIAVPCHVNDQSYLKYCLNSIQNLDSKPECVLVNINKGEKTMKQLITEMYDQVLEDCDVVLRCDADFHLFPHILKYIDEKQVVTFLPLVKKPYVLSFMLHRILLSKRTWSGCYSLPRKIWKQIKTKFDGTDTSIALAVRKWKIKSFQYYILRPYVASHTSELLSSFSLRKRIIWQLIRMKAVKIDARV